MTMFIVLSSFFSRCKSFPSSSDECRTVTGSHQPLDEASHSACTTDMAK